VYTRINKVVDEFSILRNDQLEMQWLALDFPHVLSTEHGEKAFATGYLRTFRNEVDNWLGANLSYSVYSPPKRPFVGAVHFNGADKTAYRRYQTCLQLCSIGSPFDNFFYHECSAAVVYSAFVDAHLKGPDASVLIKAIRYMWASRPLRAADLLLRSNEVLNHSSCASLSSLRLLWMEQVGKSKYRSALLLSSTARKEFLQLARCADDEDSKKLNISKATSNMTPSKHNLASRLLRQCFLM
jgi:hypothetical protein